MSLEQPSDWALRIEQVIQDFIQEPQSNTLKNLDNDPAFAAPLVGYARGDDALFNAYKEHVGPFHWTPAEFFKLAFPELDPAPSDLIVISWILPQIEATKADNRRETFYPAERWARARIFGEEVNAGLRKRVVAALTAAGVAAAAPLLHPEWSIKASDRFVYSSTWSERHAAYAAGLGTFGLCDGLITSKGKAIRTGSVIARLSIPASPRPYTDHHEYCLFFTKKTCGKCIKRCPVGALSEAGHDKTKCRAHTRVATEEYVKSQYGFVGYACGLCQTGVPCESGIPMADQD